MDDVLRWSDVLQILDTIVGFISVFVVYLPMLLRWRWSEESESYQAMDKFIHGKRLEGYLGSVVSNFGKVTPMNIPTF